uniref:DUF3837 domain-containing protein n=1 Tax=Steinernema glaseri TaxID=37863 RepID=A0A1I7Y803_9BILA
MLGNFVKKLCLFLPCHKKASACEDDDVYGEAYEAVDEELDEAIARELLPKMRGLADAIRAYPDRVIHGAIFTIPAVEHFGFPDEREVLSMDVEIVSDEDIDYALKKYENRLKRNLQETELEDSEVSEEELHEMVKSFFGVEGVQKGQE